MSESDGSGVFSNRAHQYSDVDSQQFAQHHTLGPGPNQAAAGTHKHAYAFDFPIAIVPAAFNGIGVSAKLVRSDHQHGMVTAPPITQAMGDVATEGVATTWPRSDHKHGMPIFGSPITQAFGDVAADGVSSNIARSDHKHGMPANPFGGFGTVGNSAVGDAANNGAATTASRSDHKHGRESFGARTDRTTVNAAGSDGVATTDARSDHLHGFPILTVHDQVAYSNATTTLSDITGMSAALVANGIYEIEFAGHWNASVTTCGLKLNIPAFAYAVISVISEIFTTTGASASSASMGYSTAGVLYTHTGPNTTIAGTNFYYRMKIYVKNGAGASTCKLQAAATAAGTVTLPAGGYWMKVTRLA